MQNVAHKGLVDLDGLGVQALEVTERRVTGAKIPQREPHAQRLAGAQATADMLDVFDRHRLDNLNIE
ncbi:hypothetical protein D3C81_2197200 [compost metagenome]